MKALHEHEFPTPTPISHNRHCIVMSMCKGKVFDNVKSLKHPVRYLSLS